MWTNDQNSVLISDISALSQTLNKPVNEVVNQINILSLPGVITTHQGWDDMPDNPKNLISFIYPQLQNATYLNTLEWSYDGTYYSAFFYQAGYKMSCSVTGNLLILQFEKENVWIPNLPQPIQDYITSHSLVVTKAIKGVYNPTLLNHAGADGWWNNQIPLTKYTIVSTTGTFYFDGNGNITQ